MGKSMTEEVVSYKCNWCNSLHKTQVDADECAFRHAKENLANSLLRSGRSLESINYLCGFNWKLTEEQKRITKDNCFIVSHWQCCDKPAYQIVFIGHNGRIKLSGKGSWSGYYGNYVSLDSLLNPYPAEDLYVDGR